MTVNDNRDFLVPAEIIPARLADLIGRVEALERARFRPARGIVTSLYRGAGTCTVRITDPEPVGSVTARLPPGPIVWPRAEVYLLHDGDQWVVLSPWGARQGFEDDFVGVSTAGSILNGDVSWFMGGDTGGSIAGGLYSGHPQHGMVQLVASGANGRRYWFTTHGDNIGAAWFAGPHWCTGRIIGASARPNNLAGARIGYLDDTTVAWAALTADTRAAALAFHPSYHATNFVLYVANGTSEAAIDTGVAVADQTPYEFEILWFPRSTANGRGGSVLLWINGALVASVVDAATVPDAFTSGSNAVVVSATVTIGDANPKALAIDRLGSFSVGPASPPDQAVTLTAIAHSMTPGTLVLP